MRVEVDLSRNTIWIAHGVFQHIFQFNLLQSNSVISPTNYLYHVIPCCCRIAESRYWKEQSIALAFAQ